MEIEELNVSIILPVFNAELTLDAAIDSLLAQTHSNFELIVLDDGSTDSSLNIIKHYASIDQRVRFISRENKGLAMTLNELIENCSNDIVFRMDADDISTRDRLYNQLEFLNENPEVIVVGGQIDFFSQDRRCDAFKMPLSHDEIVEGLTQGRFPICHPAIAFRRQAALDCGLYSVSVAGEDLDFFLRMSEKGMLANIPQKVLSYRISLSSLSVRKYSILSQAYSFALINYSRRKRNEPELTWVEYDGEWKNRSLVERVFTYLYGVSEKYYRRYLMCKVRSQKRCFIYLVVASSLRPKTVFVRISQMIKRGN